MLRKIVNMIMGGSNAATPPQRTYFEEILERIRPVLAARIVEDPDVDLLEQLAVEVLRATSEGENPNPQAARAFFSVLVENDQLAEGKQLIESELDLLRSLLLEYFTGNDQVRARANEVLALIEQKFSEGAFTQAKILLQIFETDAETRLNNERNLFYEDMILRLGVRRRHPLSDRDQQNIHKLFEQCSLDDEATVYKALQTLSSELYVEFCLSVREPNDAKVWEALAETLTDEDVRERLLSYVPTRRWRNPITLPQYGLQTLTSQHLIERAARVQIQSLTRLCYFLLLASGDTSFQAFLYSYLGWCRERWGVDARRLLPKLHRSSVVEDCGLQDTLDSIYDEFFAEAVAERCDVHSDESIKRAWYALFKRFSTLDFNEVPPGHYDLGGLLLDGVLGFDYPDDNFSFRLHRLT